jgi:hypothetical protein
MARMFIRASAYMQNNKILLRWWRQDWYRYDGKIWRVFNHDELNSQVITWLQSQDAFKGRGVRRLCNEVIANLEAICILPADFSHSTQ